MIGRLTDKSVLIGIVVLLMLAAAPLSAQYYFGKNKVQYTNFDWRVLTTRHFRIYFYAQESDLAEIAARSAEDSYRVLAGKFNHEIYSHIPLIIYSNANHFAQTNVTWSLIPENVAGFTEFIKGRVVVPFNGSYYDFDRVIRHELVHVFMISKINRIGREHGRGADAFPPLWFVEGLAECWSRPWDSEADLFIRDMVINGSLPSIATIGAYDGSFFLYKLGESLCHFITDQYGADKLTRLFDNWQVARKFDKIVEYTLGDNLDEVSKKWEYHLKKRHFPQISQLDLPDQAATRLTQRQFAVRPVPVTIRNKNGQQEQWVIYKANKAGYSAIYMIPADGNSGRVITLLKGERSARFESLHLLTSGVDQFENRLLAFSSKSKEQDVLYLYDLDKRAVVRRYEFDSLVAITSPRFSPDGRQVVFSGHDFNGYADIYVLTLDDGSLRQVTDDIYNDIDPCFGYDGQSIVLASDRGENGYEGYLSLYRLWLNDGRRLRLTWGAYHDRAPAESPDGSRLIFSSDRGQDGAFNIFSLDRNGAVTPITRYITGAFDPRFSADASQIYFSAYQNQGFHVFKTTVADTLPATVDTIPALEGQWFPARVEADIRATSVKYQTDYSFDIAQSSVAYDDIYGALGGVQAAMSDVLGNNTFIFLLSNTARSKDEFLTSFNVAVTYLRRTNRLNWGFGAFHLYDRYYNTLEGYYYERLVGGVVHASYPISKFDRIESSVFVRHSDKELYGGIINRRASPATQLLSLVTDNTLWDATGPLEGRRINLTIGWTYDFDRGRNYNRLGSLDLRHYLRLGQYSSMASRFFAFSSSGVEPQRLYLGGSWSFRGFSRHHFYNRNILFNSEELRFPLINDLLVAFPLGDMRFRRIQGALFHDLGTAWDDQWQGWYGSFGASIRIALGYFVVLRFDFSRTHDFHRISDHTRSDFFFGWNF
jgi:Tol biopolymer transport system component